MDSLSLMLQVVTLGFAFLAAAAALVVVVRKPKPDDTLAATVRTEADRIRADSAEQARAAREEIRGLIKDFQTATEARQEAADQRQIQAARETREALTGSFKETRESLTATLAGLGEHQKERLDTVVADLKSLSDKQAQAAEALRQTVEGRLDMLRRENSEKLDEMRKTVDEKLQTELEKRLGDSFRTVSEQLDRVHKGLGEMQTLATGVGDLKKVLSNVKTRGILGEAQLGMLLDQFLAPSQYIANAQIKPGSFVEFAIRLPGDGTEVLMPIDAKFPSEDYERLVDAAERADADALAAATTALEARVKQCARTIHDKYIDPPATTDYAILFLPTEGLFAEVVRRPGLVDQIQHDWQVTIAGPTTLTALLSAFQMGFRALALQKRSGEVWKVLGAVRFEFAKHGEVVEKLKKQLGAAANTIDALDTRTNVMNRRLKDVEMLPAAEAQDLLGLPGPNENEKA